MRYLQEKQGAEKVELDLKDRKILSLLSLNARLPSTAIAKKVALSRDAVSYRIRNMEKKGLIQGYRTIINIRKLGYEVYHIFIRLNNPSKEIEEKAIKKLVSFSFVRAILKFSGNYDFEIALVVKNLDELDKTLNKITKVFSDYLQDYEVLAIRRGYIAEVFPPNFTSKLVSKTKFESTKEKIDKKDIEILNIISENANLPLYEIAGKVNLSADAIMYRTKKLLKSGIIVRFIPAINYSALSYNLYTILMNIGGFDEKKEKILENFLETDKNMLWAVKTIGKFNLLMYLLVKNVDEMQKTLNALRNLFPNKINQHETLIAFEEYKYTYLPKGLI